MNKKKSSLFFYIFIIVACGSSQRPVAAIPALLFTPVNPGGIVIDTSSNDNTVVPQSDGWSVSVINGGYARLSYPIPEAEGKVYTEFYMKINVVLPDNFYTNPRSGFRILTTDNFAVNGLGARDANELRCGLFIWKSDDLMHLRCEHETLSEFELWKSTYPLSVGEHIIEFYGNLSKASLWYLKIDDAMVASGFGKLCLPDNLPRECVATRLRFGMDGAAGENANMNLKIQSISIADRDVNNINSPTNP